MAENTGSTEHFHLPKEPEREALQFNIGKGATLSAEESDLIGHIQQVAETLLYHWKTFPIVLPTSLTKQEDEKGLINYRDLFVAPTFDELEQVATDPFGNLKKLNEAQLQGIWNKGEFEVASINFPGQTHRWKLTQLLQKGSLNAHDSLLNDSALALRLLIITAKNRFVSPVFSLSESVKSWGRGFWKIFDLLFGMPSTSPGDLESEIRSEHQKYLIAELDVKGSYREGFSQFCHFVKDASRLSTRERRQTQELRAPAIPYIYLTPKGLDVDLRLFNKDLINHCLPVLSNILGREAKGWYVNFRQKLILNLKGNGLSNEEISKRVNAAVKEEYLQRVYKAILANAELETIEPGIGGLLVNQAKSVILMKKANKHVKEKMAKHKAELLEHLKTAYPVKSRIDDWVQKQMLSFEYEFIERNLWSAHEEAISLCEEEDLHQTIYFLRRDLNFIKERETILLKELEKVRIPNRVFTFSTRIWRPSNWITMKVAFDMETKVPTIFADKITHLPNRRPARHAQGVYYYVNKYRKRKTSTRYPMWRWYNYLHRTWAWMWNSIFLFGVVVPWCSPLSLKALLSVRPFTPDYHISQQDGMLYRDDKSTTQTLISRLVAVWSSVRKSRKDFESTPDRGLLGKSLTRHFNRFWNYVVKGFLGSVLLVVSFPVLCLVSTVVSLCLALTAPLWMPLLVLLFHMFCLLVFDIDCPGNQNKISIVLEAVVWRFLIQGTIQPVAASLFGFVLCPIAAWGISIFGVLRRGLRGFWDTAMYNIVIKSRARVPASNGFVARRIAGPGLASNYFYQIKPEQALAALEASMESEELDIYKIQTLHVIEQPVRCYRQFVERIFRPFSAQVVDDGQFKQLQQETSNYKTDLTNKINQRQWRLNTGLNPDVKGKVKLEERQLKLTILQAAKILENFYPSHVLSHLTTTEEDFWEKKSLEFRDWTGLASQMLSSTFSPSFLVPLEDTDNHFELKVQHLNLGRYITMLESANVHDDLDIVTEVHTNTGEIATKAPSLDVSYFNPTDTIIQTHHFRTLRQKKFPWSRPSFEAEFDKLAVPLAIPHPATIAISIYNRENEKFPLSFDDTLCHSIIKAIKNHKDIADPATVDIDIEPSTPDNAVEPTSIISHIAEQEPSFSDDSNEFVSDPVMKRGGSDLERRLESYVDDSTAPVDREQERVKMLGGGDHETDSVDTTNDVSDIVYSEDTATQDNQGTIA